MEQQHTRLWEKCQEFIRDNISDQQYSTWFAGIRSMSFDNNALRLFVPSSYFAEQLDQRFGDLLEVAIGKVYGQGVTLFYKYNTVQNEPASGVEVRSAEYSPIIREAGAAPANPFAPKSEQGKPFDSQLNPQYNFENYCEGESNSLALTIARTIADDPSNKTFNPLMVFGPTGVGKTHLIQAIGIRIKEHNPQARVLYVTARFFESQYTAANHKGKINDFFHFYHSIDTLIVDDVQDLGGNKPGTQNTFFHIFNQLHQNNRQIILSSDRAPSEMEGFEERLLGRFKWGASVMLDKPDTALRRNVLIKKAQQDGLSLPDDVIEYVAENVTDSIRELEGVVVSLVAHATVLNREINLDLAKIVVANAIRIRRRQVNFEMVTSAVSTYYGIVPDVLFTKSRKREISDARQMVMYMAKKVAGMSLKSIGARLGRTHATVLYACRNIDERLSVEPSLRKTVDEIRQAMTC